MDLKDILIANRRDFHKYPELGWAEYRTTAKIASKLIELGFKIFYLSHLIPDGSDLLGNNAIETLEKKRALLEGADPNILNEIHLPGLIATLDTNKAGSHIAIRCDMDAVAVQESSNSSHLPFINGFSSVHNGIMHACGHDGHMALGITLAQIIAEHKDQLSGKITFIFQPAEEGCRGAYALKDLAIFEDIQELYGFHLGICAQSGEIVANPTDFLISTKFKVEVKGKKAHAGIEPEKGHDALRASCEMASAIFSLRECSNTARVNLGHFVSYNDRNVICDKVNFEGECRDISTSGEQKLFIKIGNIIKNIDEKFKTQSTLTIIGKAREIKNSPNLIDKVKNAATASNLIVIKKRAFKACEDCGHLIKRTQDEGNFGCYFVIGNTIKAGHHQENFDLDEEELFRSLIFLSRLIGINSIKC